jgi:3-oxoacyl-[acyl-carrier protein] reductase
VFRLDDKVAVVTGGGQGIGRGIASTLADAGATVVVNDLFADRAEESAAVIRAQGGRAEAAAFDVTDIDAVDAAFGLIESEIGPVDLLVNNAGIPTSGPGMGVPFRSTTPADWRPAIELNLYGVMNCTRAVVGGMCDRGWGRIVVISSGAALDGLDFGLHAYAAGKNGALAFMRHLAAETARAGVTVNAVVLGLMETAATFMSADTVPVGRFGTGRDIGAACIWLAAEGDWVTGQAISVNGGAKMRG